MKDGVLIEDLNVYYGNNRILKDINLNIEKGMFGLLGRNGAGKSTLMKSLVTLLPLRSGSISICGVDIGDARRIRPMIGYLPQDFNIYPNMTIIEALDYLATLSNMTGACKEKALEDSLRKVNLWELRNKKVKSLSGGMKRRLGIAQAIVHSPRLLIVDEPTAGLDPEERIRFRNLLASIAKDRIVILSTHIVGDIESTCENLAVIDRGEIIYKGSTRGLVARAEGKTFKAKIPIEDYEKYNQRYIITSHHKEGDFLFIKLISSSKSEDIFQPIEPDVQDGYLSIINGMGSGKND